MCVRVYMCYVSYVCAGVIHTFPGVRFYAPTRAEVGTVAMAFDVMRATPCLYTGGLYYMPGATWGK